MRNTNHNMKGETMIACYGQTNQGGWCQEVYETGTPGARKRASQLRRRGYNVTVSRMGPQVTRVGTVQLTLVNIQPGTNPDTFDLPADDWRLETI